MIIHSIKSVQEIEYNYGFGFGYRVGYGYGDGSGVGYGYGYGYGTGSGYGDGYGDGASSIIGFGFGFGWGSKKINNIEYYTHDPKLFDFPIEYLEIDEHNYVVGLLPRYKNLKAFL